MPQKPQTLLGRFLVWRARHIPNRQFLLILSVVIGLISGLVAVFLKNTTHFIQEWIRSDFFGEYFNLYYFIFPVVGITITVFIKRLFKKKKVGEGIPTTLFAISRRNGLLPYYRTYASLITSIFTVGFGGSAGLEGPAVGTGSALGANLGRLMHINYKSRILLISCATAGSIASIFNAPIAAIIFTIEIFSLDLTFSSLIPLLLASVSGAVTSIFIQGGDYLFHMEDVSSFDVSHLPFYALLGVVSAFISVYFNRVYFNADRFFSRFEGRWTRVAIGGVLLGAIIYLIPPLYGEGYETINSLLSGDAVAVVNESFVLQYFEGGAAYSEYLILTLLLGLILFKVFATSFTIGAGGVGGIFAPSLFIGSSLGYLFSRFVNQFDWIQTPSSSFALAGMAGLMAGVLHAPLTAIFMIAEITGGYELFIPLMLVSAISFLVTRGIMPHSIYTLQLAKRGDLLTHNKDQAILTLLNLEKVIEKDFVSVKPELSLGDLVKEVSRSKRNLFPVIDEDGQLSGVLTLDDFRGIMFDTSLYENTHVGQLMSLPPALVERTDPMDQVMRKFQESGAWNLPVVENGKYIGFISKSKLFSAYRRKLIEFSE